MSTATAPTVTPTVLSLQGITAGYSGTTVLRDVSLDVVSGSVVALLGPNGAGKTTALRVAGGLVKPSKGSVTHAGDDVTSRSPAARAKSGICLIPEGRGIFPRLTVREHLYLLAPSRSQRAASVEQAMTLFPALRDRLDQSAGTMSGGQQQMVAMARCYLSSADVILLDEVSMGLGPLIVDQIYESIGELTRRGVSLLIVEQYVDRVLAIADTIHVLNRGRLIFSGAPSTTSRDELMQKYLHVATADDSPSES
jgi:branched-chain amino acid transport system ATP-binding protein